MQEAADRLDVDVGHRRPGVLGGIGQRLGHDEVRSHLDPLRQAGLDVDLELHGDRRPTGERLESGREPSLRQDRRVDAAGQLPELVERAGQAVRHAGQRPLRLDLMWRHSFLGGAQLQAQRDQALLDAVVEVAFDAAARLVGGGDHAGAGGGELGPAHGVRDGGGHELREAHDPGLGIVGKRLGLRRAGEDRPPDGPVDDDRRADRRADAQVPHEPCDRLREALVAGEPDGVAGSQPPDYSALALQPDSRADGEAAA